MFILFVHVITIYSFRFTPVIIILLYIINLVLLCALEHFMWIECYIHGLLLFIIIFYYTILYFAANKPFPVQAKMCKICDIVNMFFDTPLP